MRPGFRPPLGLRLVTLALGLAACSNGFGRPDITADPADQIFINDVAIVKRHGRVMSWERQQLDGYFAGLAQRQPVSLPVKPVNGSPAEIVDYLGGQIQVLATRLEALRQQGAGNTSEFMALEQMLGQVQEKLILAQSRIRRRG